MIKRLFVFMLLTALVFVTACGREEQEGTQLSLGGDSAVPAAPPESGGENAPDSEGVSEASPDWASPAAPSGRGQEAAVLQTAAHALDGVLYGAAAFTNTGGTNILLTEADFAFTVNGTAIRETFVPVMAEYDVIRPGETAYCTLFLPVEGLEPGAEAVLTASLRCAPAEIPPFPLLAEDGYLVQNYPDFATLSGSVGNPENAAATCELNMIHAGFYDEAGTFLGAWYFSRNASLSPGVSKPFVVHLRALPIPDLAGNCARIHLRAFGIE